METNSPPQIRTAISAHYAELSDTLRIAADYIAENRVEIATRSLRAVATASGVSPASYTRLARAIGFADYEALREQARTELSRRRGDSLQDRARRLRSDPNQPLLPRQVSACINNIRALVDDIDPEMLDAAVEQLARSRRIVLIGALASAGFTDYFAYLAKWFDDRWVVAGRNGATLGSTLAGVDAQDTVLVVSKHPYAHRSVRSAEVAAASGAKVIVLTDSHAFPGLQFADFHFIQRTESPHFFSSYAATLVLIETITGMLVARAGSDAEARIQQVDKHNRLLDEFENV
ncbi:MAG: MurR/RpiR family transcriptional regulator [Roseibium sp.]|uniref:MurR/RpiR family transcriptional regulator n=1 Tax=Roseibium sp. TaxID=1936156 RepID=UPI001B1A699E|nr:MurR/RpiR family transcriptional regulator [Roseibium sp.]MBO6508527.1 MurR/RpiR family transcriptional regulator [Roseibium sp.]MBO6895380.1 MurR/RpiR family transcriptional regulator [Roseibium sp.]MBO6931579.1 MurR/RpiR family transcriptional regulator [Roseibium sp.]